MPKKNNKTKKEVNKKVRTKKISKIKTETKLKADKIIKRHVLWAMGAGSIPLPVVDAVGVTSIQLDMLRQLCDTYKIDFYENQGKNLVSAIAGGSLARAVASLIKSIPGIGSIIGVPAMATMSGATTFALGQVFISKFEDGVTLINFDIENLWLSSGKYNVRVSMSDENDVVVYDYKSNLIDLVRPVQASL